MKKAGKETVSGAPAQTSEDREDDTAHETRRGPACPFCQQAGAECFEDCKHYFGTQSRYDGWSSFCLNVVEPPEFVEPPDGGFTSEELKRAFGDLAGVVEELYGDDHSKIITAEDVFDAFDAEVGRYDASCWSGWGATGEFFATAYYAEDCAALAARLDVYINRLHAGMAVLEEIQEARWEAEETKEEDA